MSLLPTSNLEEFNNHLKNPNTNFIKNANDSYKRDKVAKVEKSLVLSFSQDVSGCGHIRNIWWLTYLNSIFGKSGQFLSSIIPFYYYNHEILLKTRTLFFPRVFNPTYSKAIDRYYEIKNKYGFKMVYDIDDYIHGRDKNTKEEANPEYNSGSSSIPIEHVNMATDIMRKMDIVSVSTNFLANYLKNELKFTNNIYVLPNCIAAYMWQRPKREPIKEKIIKPRVLYTGSPAHYSNSKKLMGDFEGSWHEWLIKAITDNKIHFKSLGGLPWFLEKVKDKIEYQKWVNCHVYHMSVHDFKPDIGIAPLVPNYFNYSKSDIKHIEYCAAGAVSIGSVFDNGRPSPYDNNFVKIPNSSSPEFIQEQVNMVCEPDVFNEIVKKQYDILDDRANNGENSRWLESPSYINKLMYLF